MFIFCIAPTYTKIDLSCRVEKNIGITMAWFRNEVLLAKSNGTSVAININGSIELKTNLRVHFEKYREILVRERIQLRHRPSLPVITFFPISEFSYKLIRFLLNSSIIKSDNEIEKNSY